MAGAAGPDRNREDSQNTSVVAPNGLGALPDRSGGALGGGSQGNGAAGAASRFRPPTQLSRAGEKTRHGASPRPASKFTPRRPRPRENRPLPSGGNGPGTISLSSDISVQAPSRRPRSDPLLGSPDRMTLSILSCRAMSSRSDFLTSGFRARLCLSRSRSDFRLAFHFPFPEVFVSLTILLRERPFKMNVARRVYS